MDKKITTQYVLQEQIARSEHKKKPAVIVGTKKKGNFSAGTCLVCGQYCDVLLNMHAQAHGYKNREAQISAGMFKLGGIYNG